MEEFFLLQIGPVKVRKNSQNAQPHVVGSLQPNWKNCMHFFKAKENQERMSDPISKKLIGAGDLRNGVYCLKNADRGSIFEAMHKEEAVLWLQRLGRPSYGSLFTVSTKHGFELSKEFHECCDVCHRAKQTRTSFPISN